MDAVKFIEGRERLCKSYTVCPRCPAHDNNRCRFNITLGDEAAKQVELLEEWVAEHPRKTRQSVFLEQWPNATRDSGGVVNICPKLFDVDISCTDDETERTGLCKFCDDCQHKFWMQEVE